MSWFSAQPSVAYEDLIREATDESIPNGELNIVKALELTDLIRSKQAPAKDVMRSLKKRLLSTKNPNLQLSTLELIDFSIKNGGLHFITEISTREFLDSLNSKILHEDSIDYSVQQKTLKLIQNWAKVFNQSTDLKNITNLYENLQRQGFEFPMYEGTESKVMFDSNVPPEWEDSDACMICSQPFSLMNRKHHCRNCGGVYCGEHSSKYHELPDLGVTDKVRVCDNCYDEVKSKKKSHKKKKKKDVIKARLDYDSEEDDEDLKRALELSLKESQRNGQIIEPEPVKNVIVAEEEDDEDLRAAIAASLKDMEQSKQVTEPEPEKLQQPSIYDSILPQSNYQYQPQEQPPILPPQQKIPEDYYHNKLTSPEEHAIRTFTTKTMEAKYNPNEIENLTTYYKHSIPLQPKLNNELNDSISKYDQFIDLNYKIDQAMRLYNKILDERIERESYGYSHAHPQIGSPAQFTAPPAPQTPTPQFNQVPQPATYQTYHYSSEPPQPQYTPSSPRQEYHSPVHQQFTGSEQDPFSHHAKEEAFSAPPAVSILSTPPAPPAVSAPTAPTVPSSSLQNVSPQLPTVVPAPAPNKITDFNFPNVPSIKPNYVQPIEAPIVEPEPPTEELLIEL